MRNAVRLLLLTLLFLAGSPELCASISQTRVGNFFPLAASSRPEKSLQVPELRLDNPLLYGESVSGPTLWSKFDPEGLAEVTPEQAKALYEAHEKEIDAGINGQNFVMRGIASLFGTRQLFHHMNKLSYDAALKTGDNHVSTGEQALQITAAGVDNYTRGLTIASVVAAPAAGFRAPSSTLLRKRLAKPGEKRMMVAN